MRSIAQNRELILGGFDLLASYFRSRWSLVFAVFFISESVAFALGSLSAIAHEPLTNAEQAIASEVFSGVVIGPAIETLLLWAILKAITKFLRYSDFVIVSVVCLVVIAHEPAGFFTAAALAWSFLVWSVVLLSKRFTTWQAIAAATVLHGLHNFLGFLAA
jgi:hypothetical protein